MVSGSGTVADPFVIGGWEIDATLADGVVVRNTTAAFVVRGVAVHSGGSAYSGVVLDNVTSARVENVTLKHNANGIIVRSSSDVVLQGSTISQNAWAGVALVDTRNVSLNGNNVTYNRDGMNGQGSVRLLLQGSGVWLNSQDGVYLTNVTDVVVEGSTFASNGWTGLHISGATKVTVRANVAFSNGRDGISVDTSQDVSLRSNSAFSNQGGIRLYGVANASVVFNDLSANRDSGIIVEGSRGATITQNIVSASGYGGILVGSMTDVTAEGNWVSNNDYGLSLILVSRATLRFNTVTLSRENGIYLAGTDNLTLTRNNASHNANGIAIESTQDAAVRNNTIDQNEYGIYLFRSERIVVAGNRILGNAVQGFDDVGPMNRWDDGYPAGGNYWSDYRGLDRCTGVDQTVCNDPHGIGDLPYDLDTDSRDRYPLTRPPGSPNAAPVALFLIEPPIGNTTTTLLLDASSAYDVEDSASMLALRWDFDDDGVWDTPWTHDRQVTHVFPGQGEYQVRLEVRDSGGLTNVTARVVSVSPAPAGPSFITLDPFAASVLALVGGTVALGIASYYHMRRRIRRVVAAKIARFRSRGRT